MTRFTVEGTINERILAMQERKEKVIVGVMGDVPDCDPRNMDPERFTAPFAGKDRNPETDERIQMTDLESDGEGASDEP
ncbi:hypothetical protein P152DRAFT_456452 [Eremomyces bilateralis CBS 781.70]|uniref:Uncharacterized protein n=1 Tax=Eremomyces bilateralis CBS 781.70 TaxID=1392243 RepID=A0A6G1G8A6_9PEZI|nr:uncharacterized protein P152DRAFT_456452 [Eremomyces bilateralis CBS 781.70]KAF1814222.1 hypothetical protein P152DRAFT_456452 [Eremomyces bilateralis CBS 781.70]